MSLAIYREFLAAVAGRREVRRVLLAAAVTRLHVGGLTLVVLLLVQDVTASLATAGAAAGTLSLGVGFTRPAQGWLIDRIGPRTLVGAAAMHLLVSAVALAWSARATSFELLALCLALGLTTPAVSVATSSAWASMVRTSRQPAVFGADSALQDAAYVAGPLIAGGLATSLDPQRALIVLVALAALGSCALACLVPPRVRDACDHTRTGVRRVGPVGRLIGATVGLGVVYGSIGVAGVAAALEAGREDLAGPVTAALFGGGLVGNVILAPLRQDGALAGRLRGRLLFLTGSTLLLPLAFDAIALAVIMLAVGAALATAYVTVLIGVAAQAPDALRAESFGWAGAALRVGNATGAALGGLAVGASSPRLAFLLATAGAGAALVAASFPARTRSRLAVPVRPLSLPRG